MDKSNLNRRTYWLSINRWNGVQPHQPSCKCRLRLQYTTTVCLLGKRRWRQQQVKNASVGRVVELQNSHRLLRRVQTDTNTPENYLVVSIKAECMHDTPGLRDSTSNNHKKRRCVFSKRHVLECLRSIHSIVE